MIDVSDEEREAWRAGAQKNLTLTFGNGLVIENSDIQLESMTIDQTLCDENNIKYGKCSSASFKVRITATPESLKNQSLVVKIETLGYTRQLGVYKVYSDNKTTDRLYRDIVAYDAIHDAQNIDVTDWYNGLTFPMLMRNFRDSLFSYIGITQEYAALPNDGLMIDKTVNPSSLSALSTMEYICEINAKFGQITPDGLFRYVDIQKNLEALYPSETLYPDDALFPKDRGNSSVYADSYTLGGLSYQDYTTKGVTEVVVKEQDSDIGGASGSPGNTYSIVGNPLAYGQSQESLNGIASTILSRIRDIEYQPSSVTTTSYLPWVEMGDVITVYGNEDIISFPVLKRTISGITAIKDTYTADGEENAVEGSGGSIVNDIQQLMGQTNTFYRDINETRSEITKLSADTDGKVEELSTRIAQNAESITLEARRAKGEEEALSSQLSITAGEIRSEVSNTASALSSRITQTADAITAEVNRATGAEGTLSSRITQTANAITAEVTRASEAEGSLSSRITVEAGRITSEVTRATNQEKSLSSRITQTAESIESELSDTEKSLTSKITQTADSIRSEVKKADDSLSSRITQTADNITSEVNRATNSESSLSSRISQSAHTISMSVSGSVGQNTNAGITISLKDANGRQISSGNGTITLTGDVVFKSNLTDGTTRISGDNITTGTISAARIQSGTFVTKSNLTDGTTMISGNNITTGTISAARIQSGTFVTKSNLIDGSTTISGNNITTGTISADRIDASSLIAKRLYTNQDYNYGAIEINAGVFTAYGARTNAVVQTMRNGNIALYNGEDSNLMGADGYTLKDVYNRNRVSIRTSQIKTISCDWVIDSGNIYPNSNSTNSVGTSSSAFRYGYFDILVEGGTTLSNKYLGKAAKAASASTADSATKATQDGYGDNIATTYQKKITFAGTNSSKSNSLSNASWKSVVSLYLSAGTWFVLGAVEFGHNNSGVRYAHISSVANGSGHYGEFGTDRRNAVSSGVTTCTPYSLFYTTGITVYINAYQNSGSALSADAYIKAFKIGF